MNNKFVGTDAIMRRAMLKGCGFDDADIKKKPHIGIVNTYNEGAPGHAHLNGIAESIKQGMMHIYAQLCKSADQGAGMTI